MAESPQGRTRPSPWERFAPPVDVLDLAAAAEALRREPAAGEQGHRQIALFHHGPVTVALYCFEPGGELPDHVVDGPVMIHVLSGTLTVHVDDGEHHLEAGQLLRLAPKVRHDVHADGEAQMLLTMCVEGPDSHAG